MLKFIYSEKATKIFKMGKAKQMKKQLKIDEYNNDLLPSQGKVHIFWEGHKILRNLHLTFDWNFIGQK